MNKQSITAVLTMALATASGASLAVDTRSTGSDLYLRVVSLETTIAVLHRDISRLREALVNQPVTRLDVPPQLAGTQAMSAMNGCRPPVNRCVQRRGAQK